MARKKTKKSNKIVSPTARVKLLLHRLYDNNQSRMAADLGCSQALISKIVAEKQNPGARFLESLAQLPKVNPAWVQTGQGEPLLFERKVGYDGGWPVPIAEALLPGPLSSHSENLTGGMELLSGTLFRDSAYIVIVTASLPLPAADAKTICLGDRILLDSNPRRWRSNLRVLDNKLCAVRRNALGHQQINLERVRCVFSDDGKQVELYGATEIKTDIASPDADDEALKEFGKRLKGFEPLGKREPQAAPVSDQANDALGQERKSPEEQQTALLRDVIAVDDIVAIAIQLFRNF